MDLSGSLDLLRKRLSGLAAELRTRGDELNRQRLAVYGRIEPRLAARLSARTEHNCVARDIVRVGELLLFGYNVHIGLKQQTHVEDVFCLYRLAGDGNSAELEAVPLAGSFLAAARFVADFKELYTYYRGTTLDMLRVAGDKLLLVFRTGSQASDKRVFRFAIGRDGQVEYIDNRGERDHIMPPTHDFEWTPVGREQHVLGRHPHVNILDTIFVEAVGGDLTVKIENNTDSGLGIYAEPVEDKNQSLADADIAYADLRTLILLRIRPYRETTWRHLVYNKRTRQVLRIDEIGDSCLELPEDHGIVFPGGYYLESGESKHFAELGHDFAGFRLKRQIRAPSGEDVLYVFHEEQGGRYALLPYNLIDRAIGSPLLANGYARFDDGRLLLFTPELDEPARLHTMQLWSSPFCSDEHAAGQARPEGLLGRLGNAAVVRGLAELRQIARLAEDADSLAAYERLIRISLRARDGYPWLAEAEAGTLSEPLAGIHKAADAALQAFERLEQQRAQARQAVEHAAGEVRELLSHTESLLWQKPDDFTRAIAALKRRRGELVGLAEQPHVDGDAVARLDGQLQDTLKRVGDRAIKYFSDPAAFAELRTGLEGLSAEVEQADTSAQLQPLAERLDELADSLDGLSELIAGFEQADAQARASLLGATSALYGDVNRLRGRLKQRLEALLEAEQGLEFGAQLTVLEQSLQHQLARCDSPEAADEGLARAISQIETLEGRFAAQPRFAEELVQRREMVLEAFATRREQLQGERSRRASALKIAVERILEGVPRRVGRLNDGEAIHAFFAADTLIERARGQIEQLRELGEQVSADELASRLQALKEAGLRDARDRADLGSAGDSLALGPHRFSIERQALEPVLLPTGDGLQLQLAGTDYRRQLDWPEADAYRAVWSQLLISENEAVYRGEYLAALLYQQWQGAAPAGVTTLDVESLLPLVAEFAQARAAEDYQRGVHDHDAAAILAALLQQSRHAGLLAAPVPARVLAQAWFAGQLASKRSALARQAAGLAWLVARQPGALALPASWIEGIQTLATTLELGDAALLAPLAARHLVDVHGQAEARFPLLPGADDLQARLRDELPRELAEALTESTLALGERYALALGWCRAADPAAAVEVHQEAAAALLFELPRERVNVELSQVIEGLRGEHPRLREGKLEVALPAFLQRLGHYRNHVEPAFRDFARLRHQRLAQAQREMALEQFRPRPLAGFVRNRLIDELYLPLIGNNLAKQIGTVGEKRSDRSGMLLLISPPGYGKTTLMEYLADRLGMTFVRVNGPTLGHEVTGLDPAQAPHQAAREELVKLNLGLAMARNVMLYLDDIQHLGPEFLQKFISLADGTRRIDAVIDGQARTLDLRGKRFALIMAGNPYTESGERFRIPDMLANRADTYNLGDVLSGREALFADSYLENSLTAHPLSQPLAERPREEIRVALRIAGGEDEPLPASLPNAAELAELLRRMGQVRQILMRVNAAYVDSAAQDDAYRREPPFKLQGSYRNMVKLAAQLSPLLTDDELEALILDHYRGEAQTLGPRAEENLLKLRQLIGRADAESEARWQALCDEYRRLLKQGGKDADAVTKLSGLLADIAGQLERGNAQGQSQAQTLASSLSALESLKALERLAALDQPGEHPLLSQLQAALSRLGDFDPATLSQTLKAIAKGTNQSPAPATPPIIGETLAQLARSYEDTLVPLVSAVHHKLRLDQSIWEQIRHVRTELDGLVKRIGVDPAKPGQGPRAKGPGPSESPPAPRSGRSGSGEGKS